MSFIFTDSQERIYPDLLDENGNVLVAIPNVTTRDTDPADGRWAAQAAPAPQSTQTAPEEPVAPATPDPTSTTN